MSVSYSPSGCLVVKLVIGYTVSTRGSPIIQVQPTNISDISRRREPSQLFKVPALGTKTKLILFAAALVLASLGAPAVIPGAQAQGSSTLYTTLVAQNMNALESMTARVTYYNLGGSPVLTTSHNVSPYRSLTINQPSQVGLPTNFGGTAMIDASQPFGAFVYEYNGNVNTYGMNFRVDAYNASSTVAEGYEFAFPQLLKSIYDAGTNMTYNSNISIQNASAVSANVTITYTQSSGSQYVHSGIIIPPGGASTLDLPSDSALSGVPNFYGTARLTSTQPVAIVYHHYTANLLVSFAGLGTANAGTTLYLSQLLRDIYDSGSGYWWASSIVLMPLDGTSANVTVTYQSSSGSVYTQSQTAAPMGAFDLRYSAVLPGSFYGTAKLTADKPIVAVVNLVTYYDSNRGIRAAGYRAAPSHAAATRVCLPTLKKNASDAATGVTWGTGVAGRLAGSSATTVTLTYYLNDGTTVQQTYAVSPSGPMFNFDQRYNTAIPTGSTFSGVLTTNPPQPIIANVNFAADSTVRGDPSFTYEGIGCAY